MSITAHVLNYPAEAVPNTISTSGTYRGEQPRDNAAECHFRSDSSFLSPIQCLNGRRDHLNPNSWTRGDDMLAKRTRRMFMV